MGWNGSADDGRAEPKNVRHSARRVSDRLKWLVLMMALVTIGTTVVFWAWHSKEESGSADSQDKAPQKETRGDVRLADVSNQCPKTDIGHGAKYDADDKEDVGEGIVYPEIVASKKPVDLSQYTNRYFSTGAEQLMSLVFTTEIGAFPMPLPHLSENDRHNLAAILISKNEVSETDSESARFCKETVEAAKREMAKYIKAGGDPDEFLQYYNQMLVKAFEYRNDVRRQAQTILEEEPELLDDYLKTMNERFDQDGIKHLTREELE